MSRGWAINREYFARALMLFLLAVLALTSGCSDTEADAAKYAAQAQVQLDQNRIVEARKAIRKAIIARDDVSEYHLLRGRIEYAAGSFENAYLAYSEALALNPTSQEALQAVAQIGLRVGRYNESVDATDKLLILNPNQTDALLMRGLHALIKRDYSTAKTNADQILSLDQFNEGGVVLKARASFLSGRPEEAAGVLDDFEKSRPDTEAVSLTRLEIYRAQRDYRQMDQQFRDLTIMRPNDLQLRLDQANFLYKTGRRHEATKLVTLVMANPAASAENVSSAVNLWREYSVAQIDAGLVGSISASGTPAARIASARYLSDMGNPAAASILLGKMAGADANAERANIALLQGDKVIARSLSETILSTDDTHCAALKIQATLWLSDRQFEDALRSAQRASSECPDQPSLWQLTARIYSVLGDKTNVRRVFRQGIEANKQNEPLARAYSKWLVTQKSDREAIAAARRITRLSPALTSGWRLYAEICAKTRSSCVAEAQQGLVDSHTRYGVDLLPGELPPNGLFGRLIVR